MKTLTFEKSAGDFSRMTVRLYIILVVIVHKT